MKIKAFDKIGAFINGSVLTKIDGEAANQNQEEYTTMSTKVFETLSAAMMGRGYLNLKRAAAISGLLERVGVDLDASGKISIGKFDAAAVRAKMNLDERMEIKGELAGLGVLAA